PDSLYEGPEIVNQVKTHKAADDRQYWAGLRQAPLTNQELSIYQNIDSLQEMPSFRRFMDVAALLLSGYKQAGPIEIGPVNTYYSHHSIELLILRIGGRNPEQFSTRFPPPGYAPHGFHHQKSYYFTSGTYSLNNTSVSKF